ncbi:EF-hand domain-containing protein [Sphingomonas aracearum]|uniref:Histidine kinase n=1 Tax=Sphingomonas aracearum TaxID=2283317 RepID=A0A369VUG1_9SPHN|nr:EF-hand domain-containing protein [Sphingomonas aracearum]RDE05177.1 histidine kinase [Sphingomonas aracearum]
MWRYLVGAVAALLLAGAGVILFNSRARPPSPLPAAAPPKATTDEAQETALPDTLPEATAKTREEKRFGRYDKNKDGSITREEYLASRHKAYARLDTNRDGVLSFEEWSAKTIAKFATADGDRSGAMNPAEFATTAAKRKARPKCVCAPAPREKDEAED